ncbi:MAG: hypothetical protein ABIP06_11990 [Pyrinomonadaceae bacterium]
MNRFLNKQNFFASAVIVFGFAAVFFLSLFLQKTVPVLPEEYEDEDLALKGSQMKGYALGTEGLIADWYWMKSLQYIGDKMMKNKAELNINDLTPLNPRLLYPYLDNASDLDPQFIELYSYGAMLLPAIDHYQAIQIVQKGIKNNPDEWRLYHYLGYIYWKIGVFDKAAQAYEKGSTIEGAPDWMKLMSAKVRGDGGSRDTARLIYSQMLEQAADESTKESARIRLLQLDSLDERDAVRAVLKKFRENNNRCANNWREILPLLQSVKLPTGKDFRVDGSSNLVDPSDAPYLLNKEKCDIELDAKKTRIPWQ